MKKLLSLILCTVLMLTVCACSRQNPENPENTTQANPGDNTVLNNGNLKLAYSKTDSLNPFECKTKINMQISKLLYDGLFTLDGNFEPQKVIAESVIVGGRTVNVTIKDAVFSDEVLLSHDLVKRGGTDSVGKRLLICHIDSFRFVRRRYSD